MDLSPDLIDLLTEFENSSVEYLVIPGPAFEEAWSRRCRVVWGSVTVIDLDDLIAAKRAAGRPQDLTDVKLLEAARVRRKG